MDIEEMVPYGLVGIAVIAGFIGFVAAGLVGSLVIGGGATVGTLLLRRFL